MLKPYTCGQMDLRVNSNIALLLDKLKWFIEKHYTELIENFLATLHSKGPVDTIGGTVIHQVAKNVMQQQSTVKDSFRFYQYALATYQLINVYHI